MKMLAELHHLKENKTVKMLLTMLLGLGISILLTVLCVLFTPPIFKSTLNMGLELLPKNKFIEYKVQNKAELAKEWLQASDALLDDKAFFDQLRTILPSTKNSTSNKDTFFAHMFVVHDYPTPCFFTIFGKHRTMDVTWTVQGIRCKGKKQCNDPDFIKHCPPRKESR
jgi:hypothetical protein